MSMNSINMRTGKSSNGNDYIAMVSWNLNDKHGCKTFTDKKELVSFCQRAVKSGAYVHAHQFGNTLVELKKDGTKRELIWNKDQCTISVSRRTGSAKTEKSAM